MKKILLLLVIMFISFSLYSQSKISDIRFGWLRLGLSIDSVEDRVSIYNKEIVNIMKHRGINIVEDSVSIYDKKLVNDSIVQSKITSLTVSKNVVLIDVNLYFWRGKLYHILIGECLNELLEIKYGKPKYNSEHKEHTYQNGYGATSVKTDDEYTYSWITDDNISLYCVNNSYYDSRGNIHNILYTSLTDVLLYNRSEGYKGELYLIEKMRKDKNNKIKYSDF